MSIDNSHRYGHALDPRGLSQLRADLKKPTPETAREVAQQFEAMFVQQMLKTMRAASGGEMLGGQAEGQYRDLFDQQLAMNAAQGRGMGLAPVIERQLLASMGLQAEQGVGNPAAMTLDQYRARSFSRPPAPVVDPASAGQPGATAAPSKRPPEAGPTTGAAQLGGKGAIFDTPADFVRSVWDAAKGAAERLGVPVKAIVAQAALETGWGRHVIRKGDGDSSFNLFGIKSHRGWDGDSVKVPTLEYRDGAAARELASFRAYGSLQDAFDDYADFLQSNPRYRDALQAGDDADAFARGLQEAGYATDPAYADKIRRIMDSPVLGAVLAEVEQQAWAPGGSGFERTAAAAAGSKSPAEAGPTTGRSV